MKRFLALVGGVLASAGLALGLLLGGGFPGGPAQPQQPPPGDPGAIMHQACTQGDSEAMLAAMRQVMDDDDYQAMLDHMNTVHPAQHDHGGSMHQGGMMGTHGMMGR